MCPYMFPRTENLLGVPYFLLGRPGCSAAVIGFLGGQKIWQIKYIQIQGLPLKELQNKWSAGTNSVALISIFYGKSQ